MRRVRFHPVSRRRCFVTWTLLVVAGLTAGPVQAQQATPPLPEDGEAVEVQVSFFLLDILRVLDAEQAVEADLFFRLEWQDERLAEPGVERRVLSLDDVWHPFLQAISPRGLTELMPEAVLVDEDGTVRYTQRLTGKFGVPTDLRDFPLDEQVMRFPFLISNLETVALDVTAGPVVGMSESLSIPDWTFGVPELDLSRVTLVEGVRDLPGACLVVSAKRNLAHYLTKIILPLVVIVVISWTVFWTPPPQIAIQFGFAATSILTVIAYRFALASQLPPVPYSTRLDTFLNGAFIMAALALVEVVVTAQLLYKNRAETAHTVDVACRVGFPVAFALLAGYSFVL